MERWTREAHRQLRVAIHAGRTAEAVELLRSHRVVDTAHTIAGWLISSIDVPGARWLATTVVDGLSNTGLPGNDALVDRLQHALDGTAPTDLAMIPVDMLMLTDSLEGDRDDLDEPACWVNVTTGEMLWAEPDELDEFPEPPGVEDAEAWLEIVPYWPRHGWQDMADFIDTVDDPALAERLSNAIRGRGAFRYFKDVVYATEHEGHRWNLFSEERQLSRARAWLADHGLRPD